jgi:3-oxoacyl-[acyl-carrier protein] reductase
MDVGKAFRLDGKVAIVTGSGSGIGAASAAVLAGAGAQVVVADLDLNRAEQVAKRITSDGDEASARQVDVTDPVSVQALVDGTVAEFGQLDVLHNNAGILIRRPLMEVSPEEFERVLAVNLKGILYGTQAAARVMSAGASIVNTLSSIIDTSTVGTGSYAASKKGGEGLTRTFARELGPRRIRVNGVAPGWTETGITRNRATDQSGAFHQEVFDDLAAKMAATAPLGTIMDAVDSAYAVLYLSSDAGRYVSGHIVRVTGGATMA